ncbi:MULTISPECIES: S8 family peptidase [unclassified Streptomyces]|uniref:S8 family peptidase n=1 Tax=unclassified Streptomyces TaxID=2593676 RepID=UPI00379A0F74
MRSTAGRPFVIAAAVTTVMAMSAGFSPAATPASAAPAKAGKNPVPHRVQLITGDVVEVTSGRVTGFRAAPGRENIPVHIRSEGDRSLVVPLDAQRLVSSGTVDRRLFDVTGLDTAAARKAYKNGLKVIVGYRGSASAARAEVRSAGSTQVRRTLKSLNAQALTTAQADLPALWKALTREGAGQALAPASGVDKVWLDGTVTARLDVSVPQIGADKAWAAGYDGTGVKVAVLDTGVDETHPELVGQQLVEKNFSGAPDAKDRQGHGTHVASTVAGKGVRYKGVAPGASIIDGKVLDDSGSGEESGIIEAIEWAVGEGADIVNMSLGGPDSPGVEPLEEAVNTYTENNGILFAVAAGNEGRDGESTIGTPGAADGALTVGAVDDNDAMADFSSRGPRVGDGAIKPDVTAPGVDITAASAPGNAIAEEYGENPPGYMTISGTSMATPHVAGAAALLKQQHPSWKAAELKGVLTASTKDTGFTAFEQGAGRVQSDRAVAQSVYATPVSLSLGKAAWPHEDDEPITRTLTYRNTGATEVTLDLAAAGKGPEGAAAPDGMFEVSPAQITVPAGATAEAAFTADTSLEAPDGHYSGAVTATGTDQSVRTAFAVEREGASYEVRLQHLDRAGGPAAHFQSYVNGLTGEAAGKEFALDEASDSTTLRLPAGEYSVHGLVLADRADTTKGTDWIAQPKLVVDGATQVTLDARTAKPVDITLPDAEAVGYQAYTKVGVKVGASTMGFGWNLQTYENFRSAHLGPELPEGELTQIWDADFTVGEDTQYALLYGGPVTRLSDGLTRHVRRGDLARLDIGLGEPVPGKDAWLAPIGHLPGGLMGYPAGRTLAAPGEQRLYVGGAAGTKWTVGFEQLGDFLPNGWQLTDSRYGIDPTSFEAGRTYRTVFNTGVFGPALGTYDGISRSGNTLYAFLDMFADGEGHGGSTTLESVATTLYRDGEKIGESDNPLSSTSFPVPDEDGAYRLTTSITRSPKIALASTRIDAGFTFRSEAGADGDLPVSVVRFRPELDLQSRAKAYRPVLMPVEVQGSAAGDNLRSLTVRASYDGGRTWIKLPRVLGRYALLSPAKDASVSLRAEVVDKQDNTSTITVHDAFLGR